MKTMFEICSDVPGLFCWVIAAIFRIAQQVFSESSNATVKCHLYVLSRIPSTPL